MTKRSTTPTLFAYALLLAYLTFSNSIVGKHGIELIANYWTARTDFEIYYDAGKVLVSEERSLIYDAEAYGPSKSVGSFYNPPAMGLLYSPLSLLPEQQAKEVHTWIQLGLLLVVVPLLITPRSRPDIFAAMLALTSFLPFYIALENGDPASLYTLGIAFALMAVRRSSIIGQAFALGFLVIKPHFLVLPFLMILVKGHLKVAAYAAVVAGVIFVTPFLWVGYSALVDYVSLLLSRFVSDTDSASYDLPLMGNWNGFWFNIIGERPPLAVVSVSSLLTLLIAQVAVVRGGLTQSWFAALAATLLAAPHILPYDWLVLVPASYALLLDTRRWILGVLLTLVHAAMGFHFYVEAFHGPLTPRWGQLTTHWSVPALFVVILFLAFSRIRESGPSTRQELGDLTAMTGEAERLVKT